MEQKHIERAREFQVSRFSMLSDGLVESERVTEERREGESFKLRFSRAPYAEETDRESSSRYFGWANFRYVRARTKTGGSFRKTHAFINLMVSECCIVVSEQTYISQSHWNGLPPR